jgi:hypothetical protein
MKKDLRVSRRDLLSWYSEWYLRAWFKRPTLRPLFKGLTFSLNSSHSLPVSCFDARNSVSGSIRHFLLLLESWERDCNCDCDWNKKLAVSYTNWFVSAACFEMLPKGSRACVGLGHAYKRQWSCEKRRAFVWAGECLIQTIFLTGYTEIG